MSMMRRSKGIGLWRWKCRSEGEVGPELEATIAKKPLIYLIVKFKGIYI